MPVKAGNCVKTGARVLVLDYGKVQTLDSIVAYLADKISAAAQE